MTTEKLLEAFTKHSREAKRNARLALALQKEIVMQVNQHRNRKAVKIKNVAFAAKLPLTRTINILYNGAELKPSEAKAILQAING